MLIDLAEAQREKRHNKAGLVSSEYTLLSRQNLTRHIITCAWQEACQLSRQKQKRHSKAVLVSSEYTLLSRQKQKRHSRKSRVCLVDSYSVVATKAETHSRQSRVCLVDSYAIVATKAETSQSAKPCSSRRLLRHCRDKSRNVTAGKAVFVSSLFIVETKYDASYLHLRMTGSCQRRGCSCVAVGEGRGARAHHRAKRPTYSPVQSNQHRQG